MDDNDTEIINKQIEALNTNRITQKQLIDKQTIILKTEINVLENVFKKYCKTNTLQIQNNMFPMLENRHTIHYLLNAAEKINIICYNKHNVVNCINTGIIELTSDCEIRTDRLIQQIQHKTEGISEAKLHFFCKSYT